LTLFESARYICFCERCGRGRPAFLFRSAYMKSSADGLIAEIRARVVALGFELVDVRQRGAGRRRSLQVRIDRPDSEPGHGVTADDCAAASRAIEGWLDETGILGNNYVLEVSSPGLERPIRWPEHWRRFIGHDVRVRLPGTGRVRATIVKLIDEDTVVLRRSDGGEVTVSLQEADDATLVVDWAEIDRSLSRRASKEKA
jgi:ribosome maturation factor RimP